MFVAPNLAILGLFTFLPIVVNLYFAFTGGVQLYPSERPFTGLENLATLFDCESYLDPSSCRKDLFWRAIYNTGKFALLQVALMVAFALSPRWCSIARFSGAVSSAACFSIRCCSLPSSWR